MLFEASPDISGSVESMDLEFQIVEPDEHHPGHFVVVAVFESGEELEVIGFKNRRDAVIVADTA